ncbi:MAG: carbohydrate kinase [Bacteroidales bacterium]
MTHSDTILCAGEVLWDVLGPTKKPGGAPMNVALHLARFGFRVQMFSRVGADALGKELLDFMKSGGLDTGMVQTDPDLPTSRVLVTLDGNGNASYDIPGPVAWDRLEVPAEPDRQAAAPRVVVYGSLASRDPRSRKTIRTLLQGSALRVMDVNLRPPFTDRAVVKELLPLAQVAKMNDEELVEIARWAGRTSGSLEEHMVWAAGEFGLERIVVTRGAEGALLSDGGEIHRHPGFKVRVADTVGAGDAFLAGLVASHLEGRTPADSLAYACATGALVASRTGGTPPYAMHEIQSILKPSSQGDA